MKRLLVLLIFFVSITATNAAQTCNNCSFFMLNFTSATNAGGTVDSLTTITVTNSAALDIDLSPYSGYTVFKYFIYNVTPATANTDMQFLVSPNGTTFDNSAGNYQWTFVYSIAGGASGGGGAASATNATIAQAMSGTSTVGSVYEITVFNPASAGKNPTWSTAATYLNNSGSLVVANGGGQRMTAQATLKNRIQMSTGNISATVKVIGIR